MDMFGPENERLELEIAPIGIQKLSNYWVPLSVFWGDKQVTGERHELKAKERMKDKMNTLALS